MGAVLSVAMAIARRFGAHRLFGEMPPGHLVEQEDMGLAVPAAGGDGEGIDVLPDGVLAHILGFLLAEEAVRTCVLARRWQHLWKSATGLHIVAADGQFLGNVEKLIEFMDHLLTLREGASLDVCGLEVVHFSDPSGNWHSGKDVLRRLNSWFRHAVTCRVQFLRVRIRCADKCAGSPWHDLEDLPLVSRHLTRLEIHGVQLGSRLLDFSSCPALEHLVLEWCDLSMLAEKISFQSLKYLNLTGPLFNRDFRIHIYAPCLLSLCLDNFGGRTPVIGSIPSLEEALVRITGHCEDYCTLWWGEYCDCDFCNSSDNISGGSNNCVLLKGLSEA